jgi:hypothetical protein
MSGGHHDRDDRRHDHGSPRHVVTNWTEYQAPFVTKLGLAIRNAAIRLKLQECCGHPGQPGC